MNNLKVFLLLLVAATITCSGQQIENLDPEDIKAVMTRVCDWQLENLQDSVINRAVIDKVEPIRDDGWIRGTFYAGVMAHYYATSEKKYLDSVLAWGEKNNWLPGPRHRHADDQTVAQVYAEIFFLNRDENVLEGILQNYELMIQEPLWGPEVGWSKSKNWSWCDALFMAPPGMARIARATGQEKYLDLMDRLFWDTYEYIYDKEEKLFYRDINYIVAPDGKQALSPSGKKIFWGRGNGWVLAGLARTLEYLPKDYPSYPKYVSLFQEMANKISEYQQEDGLWRSSLNEPTWFPNPETSSSSMFCFAMAFGINNGLLDSQKFLPIVNKAWTGLVSCVQEDGRLAWVQLTGHDPRIVNKYETVEYGSGAFLLAGNEMLKIYTKSTPTWPNGEWKRHTIDDSSQGADGTRFADINGDGLLDITSPWEQGGEVRVYIHPTGSEMRKPWPRVTVGKVGDPEDSFFVDLDGDGFIDVVSSCEGKTKAIFVHWSPKDKNRLLDPTAWETEEFSAASGLGRWMYGIALQLDNKNGIDLVAGCKEGYISWFESPENPRDLDSWKVHPLLPTSWTMTLSPSDIDQDGDMDVVATERRGSNRGVLWLENPGADEATSIWNEHRIGPANEYEAMHHTVTDLDGDGLEDVLNAVKGGPLKFHKRVSQSPLVWETYSIEIPPSAGGGKAVKVGDINLDGQLDLAVSSEHAIEGKIGTYWMFYDQSPTEAKWTPTSISGPEGYINDLIQLIDLDGDGDLDVVTVEEKGPYIDKGEKLKELGVIWYENPAQTDLMKIIKDYADAMIEYGRDDARYGDQTSPLFAVLLQRDTETPVMLPYPQIPVLKNDSEPGHRWKYYTGTNFINIPFLEGEKLHKLTVSGEDVMEHYGLYRALYLLTELSGDSSYKNTADQALTWWYEHTQGPSGLFPWGEHLGWDFRYDFVSYHVKGHEDFYNNPAYDYKGTPVDEWVDEFVPITQLYQAFQHEPRTPELNADFLLENLRKRPLSPGETFTPLEKFAFGCWREHVIDLDSGGYNRHGDYFGRRWGVEGKYAGTGNYPRIIGLFFDYWSYTWMHTTNPLVADSLETIIDIMVDDCLSDLDDRGIIHHMYRQVWKAAAGATLAAERLAENNPALSEKLLQFADGQVSALYGAWPEGNSLEHMMTLWSVSQRDDLKPYLKEVFDDLYEDNPDSLTTASAFAHHIHHMVSAYEIFSEEKYILKGKAFVRQALDTMFDDYSPLPRVNTSDTLYAGDGTGYANFYHAPGGSDDLMWALALFAKEAGCILED